MPDDLSLSTFYFLSVGGRFHLEIKIPETYPFNPPKVRLPGGSGFCACLEWVNLRVLAVPGFIDGIIGRTFVWLLLFCFCLLLFCTFFQLCKNISSNIFKIGNVYFTWKYSCTLKKKKRALSHFKNYIKSPDGIWHCSFSGAFHHKDLASQHQLSDRSNMSGHFERPVVSGDLLCSAALCSPGEECKKLVMCHSGQLLWPSGRSYCHYRHYLLPQSQTTHRMR